MYYKMNVTDMLLEKKTWVSMRKNFIIKFFQVLLKIDLNNNNNKYVYMFIKKIAFEKMHNYFLTCRMMMHTI